MLDEFGASLEGGPPGEVDTPALDGPLQSDMNS